MSHVGILQGEKVKPAMKSKSSPKQDSSSRMVLLLPTILMVLFLSIFPLIISLFLSFARVNFARGGVEVVFVGVSNYQKLLFGSQQRHLLGKFSELTPLNWILLALITVALLYWLFDYIRGSKRSFFGAIFRLIAALFIGFLSWLLLSTLTNDGLPGTVVVTLVFVFVGVFLQYAIGLGLALLLVQELPGKRIFRIIFLLPMMITPVGIAFLFRMLTDTHLGPLAPLLAQFGDFSWLETAWGARAAVIVGDVWQWTPFMFIILLAALEGTSREQLEASLVDGASRLQIFRYIVLPQIAPVSLTVVMIRIIEAFKIIDIPRILTGGGPGTATESLTLHSYIEWRSPNLGGSAAISYLLLVLVTFVALLFVNVLRKSVVEKL